MNFPPNDRTKPGENNLVVVDARKKCHCDLRLPSRRYINHSTAANTRTKFIKVSEAFGIIVSIATGHIKVGEEIFGNVVNRKEWISLFLITTFVQFLVTTRFWSPAFAIPCQIEQYAIFHSLLHAKTTNLLWKCVAVLLHFSQSDYIVVKKIRER